MHKSINTYQAVATQQILNYVIGVKVESYQANKHSCSIIMFYLAVVNFCVIKVDILLQRECIMDNKISNLSFQFYFYFDGVLRQQYFIYLMMEGLLSAVICSTLTHWTKVEITIKILLAKTVAFKHCYEDYKTS